MFTGEEIMFYGQCNDCGQRWEFGTASTCTCKEEEMTPNTIQFHSGTPATEVLRLSKDGIWANPDIPADDAAKLVLSAIGDNIEILVQKAVLAEREACAKVCEDTPWSNWFTADCAAAIRARENT
jgi:hypothetical protein